MINGASRHSGARRTGAGIAMGSGSVALRMGPAGGCGTRAREWRWMAGGGWGPAKWIESRRRDWEDCWAGSQGPDWTDGMQEQLTRGDPVGQGEITSRGGPCFPRSMRAGRMAVPTNPNVHQATSTVPEGRSVVAHARGMGVGASRRSRILVAIRAQVATWDQQSLLVERSWLPAG
jgi:hypothetical protein